jgi:hypothetical protein
VSVDQSAVDVEEDGGGVFVWGAHHGYRAGEINDNRTLMPKSSAVIHRSLHEGEAFLDWVKYRLRRHREAGLYYIQPYRGHGTADDLYISMQNLPSTSPRIRL